MGGASKTTPVGGALITLSWILRAAIICADACDASDNFELILYTLLNGMHHIFALGLSELFRSMDKPKSLG
jgi:hypothetical protein